MRRISGEIDGRQSAGEQDLGVVFQRFFGGSPLPPGAGAQQSEAGQIEQNQLPCWTELADVILISEVSEKDQPCQQHHDADSHEPISAQAHFEGGFSRWRRRGRDGRRNGNENRWPGQDGRLPAMRTLDSVANCPGRELNVAAAGIARGFQEGLFSEVNAQRGAWRRGRRCYERRVGNGLTAGLCGHRGWPYHGRNWRPRQRGRKWFDRRPGRGGGRGGGAMGMESGWTAGPGLAAAVSCRDASPLRSLTSGWMRRCSSAWSCLAKRPNSSASRACRCLSRSNSERSGSFILIGRSAPALRDRRPLSFPPRHQKLGR